MAMSKGLNMSNTSTGSSLFEGHMLRIFAYKVFMNRFVMPGFTESQEEPL